MSSIYYSWKENQIRIQGKSEKAQSKTIMKTLLKISLIAAIALTFNGCGSNYAKEQARYAKVLKEAPDEELFLVLNYAIAHHFVPNMDIDPYYDIHVMVGCWKRSLMVYDNLSCREDLLRKIYPDLKVLDEYVNWRRHGEPYPDTIVSKAIMDNASKECLGMDDKLVSKYFGTPLLRD